MASLLKTAVIAIGLLSSVAQSQFVPAPTDLIETKGFLNIPVRYKEVPDGICETTPGVRSYSGYVDIDEHQHIFFWFFEARNADPTLAPLTVWINGGPGSSSMIGLFQELGPCGIDSNGDLYNNPYAWNNITNMIFIDQPAQTGFSYSDAIPGYLGIGGMVVQLPEANCPSWVHGCATYSYPSPAYTANSTKNAAPGMWKTLQGFMGAFPLYSRAGFNFATESYGGHYGPVFNEYIVQQNELIDSGQLPGGHHIHLNTVLIGNGWYNPITQYEAYYNYSVNPGNTYDVTFKNPITREKMYNAMYGEGNCLDMSNKCRLTGRNDVCSAADNFCYTEVEYVLDKYLGRDEYDIRELTPDPFPYNFYPEYLNTPKVQQAVGAFVNFTDSSNVVGSLAFGNTGDDDRGQGSVKACKKLVNQGIYMVQFNGDADYICNWIGNEAVAYQIDAPGWADAGYTNISTSDGIVHGQVKQSANFAFARIYEAGHEVPFYQPVVAIEMLERAINGLDIATGTTQVMKGSSYKTSGPLKSTYREGGGTVQNKVLPTDSTYNTTTNEPNPPSGKEKRNANAKIQRPRRPMKPRFPM